MFDEVSMVARSSEKGNELASVKHEIKDSRTKGAMYDLWHALQARDLAKVANIISSLGGFGAALFDMTPYLSEIRRIRKEEEQRARTIRGLYVRDILGPEVSLFSGALNEYNEKRGKITEAIAKSMMQIGYYNAVADRQKKYCNARYDSLVHRYGEKPKTIEVAREMLSIELMKQESNNTSIEGLSKEQKNLERQFKKLESLHKKIKGEFVTRGEISHVVSQEAARLLASLEKEISEVKLLVTKVTKSIKRLEEFKRESELRAKELGVKSIDDNNMSLIAAFIGKIFKLESSRKCAVASDEHASHHKVKVATSKLNPHRAHAAKSDEYRGH